MQYVSIAQNRKSRYLISGLQNSGKSQSLITFLCGTHDPLDPSQLDDSIAYANNRSMVVIACPGEFGTRKTLQPYVDLGAFNLEVYELEVESKEVIESWQWSDSAMKAFNAIIREKTIDNPCDILAVEGLHSLWDHGMNLITSGDWFAGRDLRLSGNSDKLDTYQQNGYYNRAHNTFTQYVVGLYTSPSPLVICTCWEDWKGQESDSAKAGDAAARRYLWLDIPGKMATRSVGMFDARLSARKSTACYHPNCEDSKNSRLHFVWQFAEAGDLKGLAVKGLRLTSGMMQKPWIHQNYPALQGLLARKESKSK